MAAISDHLITSSRNLGRFVGPVLSMFTEVVYSLVYTMLDKAIMYTHAMHKQVIHCILKTAIIFATMFKFCFDLADRKI